MAANRRGVSRNVLINSVLLLLFLLAAVVLFFLLRENAPPLLESAIGPQTERSAWLDLSRTPILP